MDSKIMIGTQICKLDAKNRIYLPSFTNRKENDELAIELFEDNQEIYFKLSLCQNYLFLIERLYKLRDKANSLEEYEKYSLQIEEICQKINNIVTVSKERRILLPMNICQSMQLEKGDSLLVRGLGNSLKCQKIK